MISIYLLPHFPYYPLPFTFVPMARITNPPQGIILSSALGDIILDVEGTYIYVALTNSAHATILRERYYVHDGKVTLCDLASLIEADMRTHRLTLDTYYLELFASTDDYENGNEDDHAILTVLYCDRFTVCNDVPQFLRENFLITLQVQRITPTATASLSYYADKDELLVATVESIWKDIFHMDGSCETGFSFPDYAAYLFRCARKGAEDYPNFLTAHSIAIAKSRQGEAKSTMEHTFAHMKAGMLKVLRADPAVNPTAFSPAFTESDLTDFVLDNILLLLVKNAGNCTALVELIRRVVYR